jgi:hypothetical protein
MSSEDRPGVSPFVAKLIWLLDRVLRGPRENRVPPSPVTDRSIPAPIGGFGVGYASPAQHIDVDVSAETLARLNQMGLLSASGGG